jgi:hypothetical protein
LVILNSFSGNAEQNKRQDSHFTINFKIAESSKSDTIEKAIIDAYHIPAGLGIETGYSYHFVNLTESGGQVVVVLFGPNFDTPDGHYGLVLQSATDGWNLVSPLRGLNYPIILSQADTIGWKDLICLERGVEPTQFAVIRKNAQGYELLKQKLETGTYSGTALIPREEELRFVVP